MLDRYGEWKLYCDGWFMMVGYWGHAENTRTGERIDSNDDQDGYESERSLFSALRKLIDLRERVTLV